MLRDYVLFVFFLLFPFAGKKGKERAEQSVRFLGGGQGRLGLSFGSLAEFDNRAVLSKGNQVNIPEPRSGYCMAT